MAARILLVEDDEALQSFLCEVLEQEGFAVDSVATKARADAALRASHYDLLIYDVRLPDGNGHDVGALASAAGTKTLAICGHPDDLAAMAANGLAHLQKPFRVSEFIVAVRQLLTSGR